MVSVCDKGNFFLSTPWGCIRGNGVIAAFILNVSARWRLAANFTARPHAAGALWRRENLMLLPLIEPVTSSLYPGQKTDCSTAPLLCCQLHTASYLRTKHVIVFLFVVLNLKYRILSLRSIYVLETILYAAFSTPNLHYGVKSGKDVTTAIFREYILHF
jgi:hypothetical protein